MVFLFDLEVVDTGLEEAKSLQSGIVHRDSLSDFYLYCMEDRKSVV